MTMCGKRQRRFGMALGLASAIAAGQLVDAPPVFAIGGEVFLPPEWTLLSPETPSGTIVLVEPNYFLGSSASLAIDDGTICTQIPSGKLRPADGGDVIQATAIQLGCAVAFVPPEPLPSGEYCVVLDAPEAVPGEACFTVTGRAPSLAEAQLESELNAIPGDEEESCVTCPDGWGGEGCAQRAYDFSASLTLHDVFPEIVSTHLFALALVQGADDSIETPLPDPAIWKVWRPVMMDRIRIPWEAPVACIGLYARPIGGEESTLLARTCLQRPAQTAFPQSPEPPPGCWADYLSVWCSINHADCTTEEAPAFAPDALAACDVYAARCNPDGTIRPAQTEQEPEDVLNDDDVAETDAGADVAEQASQSSTCSAAPFSGRGSLWVLFFALAVWSARRARLRGPRDVTEANGRRTHEVAG